MMMMMMMMMMLTFLATGVNEKETNFFKKSFNEKRIPAFLERFVGFGFIQGYLHGKPGSNIIAAPDERSMHIWPMILGPWA